MQHSIQYLSAMLEAAVHCWQTNIHQKISGKHVHTYTHTRRGNLGVDLVSTAQLDKGDYPHCVELGSVCVCACGRVCVCVYTLVLIHMHLLCLLLKCLYTLCVGVCVPSCVTAFQATEGRDYQDFPSRIFSRVAEKYYQIAFTPLTP